MVSSRNGVSGVGVGVRSGGVVRNRSLSPLDVEILRFLARFQMVRPHHVAEWTGASPYTVDRRLRFLGQLGLARRHVTDIALRDASGRVRATFCTVWSVTGSGAGFIGTWEVPGTGVEVTLPVARVAKMTSHHVLGVADLAVWYRHYGYEVAAEREIRSLEQQTQLAPERVVHSFWAVKVPGRAGVHPPDMGAVAPDGGVWAVELERATKTVQEYQQVIAAYRAAGMGQVWHIQSQATARRVMEACTRLGIIWGSSPVPGVTASAPDGLIRLQGWLPGRAGLAGPSTWKHQIPRSAPAGIPVPEDLPDLSATWRRHASVIDVEHGDETQGGVFW